MDVFVTREGQRFTWDAAKSALNLTKHGVSFDRAVEVFFDPLHKFVDADTADEDREAAIGLDAKLFLLFVVHLERQEGLTRIISAREATKGNGENMKTLSEKLKTRHQRNRPMVTISLRMPEDIVEDLKEMAPIVGCGGYQPLIRAYISAGLRKDEANMERTDIRVLRESLKKHGVGEVEIAAAVTEALRKTA